MILVSDTWRISLDNPLDISSTLAMLSIGVLKGSGTVLVGGIKTRLLDGKFWASASFWDDSIIRRFCAGGKAKRLRPDTIMEAVSLIDWDRISKSANNLRLK